MSKNSFTKNFNSCVAGLPIASVAAHIVLNEGLLKDIGKLGALAGVGYLGYNYGDKIGDAANAVGDWFGANDTEGANAGTNAVGRALTGAHNWMKNTVEDNWLGHQFNLGGERAFDQQYYDHTLEDLNNRALKQRDDTVALIKSEIAAGKLTDQNEIDAKMAAADETYKRALENNQVRATEMMRSNAAKGDKERGIAGHEVQHTPQYYNYDTKGNKIETPVGYDKLYNATNPTKVDVRASTFVQPMGKAFNTLNKDFGVQSGGQQSPPQQEGQPAPQQQQQQPAPQSGGGSSLFKSAGPAISAAVGSGAAGGQPAPQQPEQSQQAGQSAGSVYRNAGAAIAGASQQNLQTPPQGQAPASTGTQPAQQQPASPANRYTTVARRFTGVNPGSNTSNGTFTPQVPQTSNVAASPSSQANVANPGSNATAAASPASSGTAKPAASTTSMPGMNRYAARTIGSRFSTDLTSGLNSGSSDQQSDSTTALKGHQLGSLTGGGSNHPSPFGSRK